MPFREEIYLAPELPDRNLKTGRYMKGHVPHCKGKKWDEYMPKASQLRSAKGWENLAKYRNTTPRSEDAGRPRKPVIAITDEGRWFIFPSMKAAERKTGFYLSGIARCCRQNANETGGNTDHKYHGLRWYYEEDMQWTTKTNL